MITKSNGQTICNINTRCELEYLFAVIDELREQDKDGNPEVYVERKLEIRMITSSKIQLNLSINDDETGNKHILVRDLDIPVVESYSKVSDEIKAAIDRLPIWELCVNDDIADWFDLYNRALARVKAEVLTHLEKFD